MFLILFDFQTGFFVFKTQIHLYEFLISCTFLSLYTYIPIWTDRQVYI